MIHVTEADNTYCTVPLVFNKYTPNFILHLSQSSVCYNLDWDTHYEPSTGMLQYIPSHWSYNESTAICWNFYMNSSKTNKSLTISSDCNRVHLRHLHVLWLLPLGGTYFVCYQLLIMLPIGDETRLPLWTCGLFHHGYRIFPSEYM